MSEAEFEASVIHQRVIEAISDVVPETAKEEVADKVISIITEEIETYSGSVPHPRHAEHWERILPGAANRILSMADQRRRSSRFARTSAFNLLNSNATTVTVEGLRISRWVVWSPVSCSGWPWYLARCLRRSKVSWHWLLRLSVLPRSVRSGIL